MTRILNLDDIQGNVTRAYGRFSFPFARYFFLHIETPEAGRKFVDAARRRVTTATRWTEGTKPPVTFNIGFTFTGLYMMGLPTRTLQGMPEAFIDGMKARAFILGDRDVTKTEEDAGNWCAKWDPIWRDNRMRGVGGKNDVHIWISMNAQLAEPGTDTPAPELEEQTDWLRELCAELDHKVWIMKTNGQNGGEEYQAASAVFDTLGDKKIPTPKEHFGITDGIGDPVFEGQYPEDKEKVAVIGRGKWMNEKDGWQPLATGEFILGHPDESQELPPTAQPPNFMHNGTYMVYRKLHENVSTFAEVVGEEAKTYAATMGVDEEEARETLIAKMVGRWSDGVPLARVPTYDGWRAFRKEKGFDDPDPLKALGAMRAYLSSTEVSNFRYADDLEGFKCPNGAHLRRVNTRDYLDPLNTPGSKNPKATTQLNKRRRILRRGLPYGPDHPGGMTDETEQGVAFMALGASIFRQFEFVQQQWIQYGLDFNQGNNTCPLLGSHEIHKRHSIPSDPASGKPPYYMSKLKTFVETRGGDYFFIPSLTALHMMALGIVDPT
ncbi:MULTISPECIES: Dyp-type peroxidase [unclassified Meridianimarinicoccus]|uniref:Dyp-type peroxidase n=1 Tax=unclassified Meridianimarinicoccus TaxID=2923344 RepID=UPI0018695D88|nr:peroxidase [Fluviibacterium sp. MJW13]